MEGSWGTQKVSNTQFLDIDIYPIFLFFFLMKKTSHFHGYVWGYIDHFSLEQEIEYVQYLWQQKTTWTDEDMIEDTYLDFLQVGGGGG